MYDGKIKAPWKQSAECQSCLQKAVKKAREREEAGNCPVFPVTRFYNPDYSIQSKGSKKMVNLKFNKRLFRDLGCYAFTDSYIDDRRRKGHKINNFNERDIFPQEIAYTIPPTANQRVLKDRKLPFCPPGSNSGCSNLADWAIHAQ